MLAMFIDKICNNDSAFAKTEFAFNYENVYHAFCSLTCDWRYEVDEIDSLWIS